MILVVETIELNELIIYVTPFDVVILVFFTTWVTVFTRDVITVFVAIVVSLAKDVAEFKISLDSSSVNDSFSVVILSSFDVIYLAAVIF